MKTTRLALLLAACSLAVVACSPAPSDTAGGDGATDGTTPSSEATQGPITADRTSRESVAAAVLESFARGDWDALSTFVAPAGVRFTPHTHVDVSSDVVLTQAEVANFASIPTVRTWGTAEGSGAPIEMSNTQYLARYVWDHDYRTAPDVRWNHVQDRGSVIDNVQQVYPGASVVEYNFPGFDEQYGGMDWRSLRLVLAQDDDGDWVLYGVIHDEWAP